MHKLFITTVLVFSLAVSMTACRSTGSDETVQASEPVQTADPAQTEPATEATRIPDAVAFEETILVDSETCAVRITAIEDDPVWGYTMKVHLENRTDKELMFSVDQVSVNGFMCDPFWAEKVMPGMKANQQIHFLSEDFQRNGISSPTEISFTLNVYDANDFTADYLVSQVFTIYPLGEDAVEEFIRTPESGETVLFDNAYATMIITGTETDDIWGYGLNVYLENKTDKALMFSASDVSVNGFMCDPFWAVEIAPGKRSNTTISWLSDTLEENGITAVESIVLPITVSDPEDWMAEKLVNETFTYHP